MLRRLGIRYVVQNPGSSFAGLHDSLVNYLGNQGPHIVLCLHEEHAVALAQLCYFSAVQYLSVGVALLLEYLAPVLLIFWHWGRNRRRPAAALYSAKRSAVDRRSQPPRCSSGSGVSQWYRVAMGEMPASSSWSMSRS